MQTTSFRVFKWHNMCYFISSKCSSVVITIYNLYTKSITGLSYGIQLITKISLSYKYTTKCNVPPKKTIPVGFHNFPNHIATSVYAYKYLIQSPGIHKCSQPYCCSIKKSSIYSIVSYLCTQLCYGMI